LGKYNSVNLINVAHETIHPIDSFKEIFRVKCKIFCAKTKRNFLKIFQRATVKELIWLQ